MAGNDGQSRIFAARQRARLDERAELRTNVTRLAREGQT
jgi:hypothetical protein